MELHVRDQVLAALTRMESSIDHEFHPEFADLPVCARPADAITESRTTVTAR